MKLLRILLLAASLLSTLGCNIDSLATRFLYPYQRVNKDYPVPVEPPPEYAQTFFELQRETGKPYKVHAWYHAAPEANTTIVYFHGNGENLQTLHQFGFLNNLLNSDVNIVAIDYPNYGLSTGDVGEETFVGGAVAAIHFAAAEFPQAKVVVWGRSLGASVATLAFARAQDSADRLVLTSPWTNFYDVAVSKVSAAKRLSKQWRAENSYDSATAAESIEKPVLIHHGESDTLIPVKFSRELVGHFKNHNATLVELPGRSHNDMFGEEILWEGVTAFASEGPVPTAGSLANQPAEATSR